MNSNSRSSLNALRNDFVVLWLPMRQESVVAVERARARVKSSGAATNNVKYYSSDFKACTSAVSFGVRVASVAGMQGTGVFGGLAALTGLGCDATKAGANCMKAYKFQKIMKEAQQAIDREMDAYKVVSDKMSGLGGSVPRGGAKVQSKSCPYDFNVAANAATHLESGHYFANTHTAEVGNDAGTNTALSTLCAMAESKPPISSLSAKDDIMEGLRKSEDAVMSITTENVKAAVDNSIFSPFLPANTTEVLTKASGKEATCAAFKALEMCSDEKGGRLVIDAEKLECAINHTF